MSRIAKRFSDLAAQARGALIPYLEAYDPDRETSLALLRAMPAAGADLIEIGMPFSDPSADGPVIQAAALRGLKAGATLAGVLDMVAAFRQDDADTPIILMGYVNPVESYGYERFCKDAVVAGVDGVILVDLPPEEADVIEAPAKRRACYHPPCCPYHHARAAGLCAVSCFGLCLLCQYCWHNRHTHRQCG